MMIIIVEHLNHGYINLHGIRAKSIGTVLGQFMARDSCGWGVDHGCRFGRQGPI